MRPLCSQTPSISLTTDELESFKQLYQQHYQVCLTDDQARFLGERLVSLFLVVARPIPKVDSNVIKDNTEDCSDVQ